MVNTQGRQIYVTINHLISQRVPEIMVSIRDLSFNSSGICCNGVEKNYVETDSYQLLGSTSDCLLESLLQKSLNGNK